MVMMVVRMMLGMAMGIEAGFLRSLGFDGGMSNAMLLQFFSDSSLDFVGRTVGDDVQGGTVGMIVQTPEVDMVNIRYAVDSREMVFELRGVDGGFLEEQVKNFLQVSDGVKQNICRHGDR